MASFVYSTVLLALLGLASAQSGVINLDFERYQGTWHLIEIGPPLNGSAPWACIQETYRRNEVNPYLADVHWQGGREGNRMEERGWASLPMKNGGSNWNFYISEMVFHSTILATDYNNWTIEKTVANEDATGQLEGYERIMIRSRTREIAQPVLSALNALVRGYGYDTTNFEMVDQKNC